MQTFVPGQRWVSETELDMGLGTVLAADPRTVTIVFLATGETRTYARQSAPLSRVAFAPGDRVASHEGWSLTVETVAERDGLLSYGGRTGDGRTVVLPEGELDNFMQLNRPADRLLAGRTDADKWFDLRYRTRRQVARLAASDLLGLAGARTSLIPHQLYIAHEVARRHAPRVLLADEVGLGKTVEAGLVLHQQLLAERARRVLIVLPESLQHQWLVEMRRRFNLRFSLFDEARCRAAEEDDGDGNPFHTEQLVICSLPFLVERPARREQALAGDWDLLVVDEAHHLQWSPCRPSPEYRCVEALAVRTPGVLLLTATPEQLGKEGHFARLRLLDPDRFPDFDAFLAEEHAYEPVAGAVRALLDGVALDPGSLATLRDTLPEGDNQRLLETLLDDAADAAAVQAARAGLMAHLLDRHGTGRVLFRNTRAAVAGFPERRLHGYPLPLPTAYAEVLADAGAAGEVEPAALLCLERLYTEAGGSVPWTRIDPRAGWLIERLRALRPGKVLVIAASAATVLDLAEALRVEAAIHAAVFHEGMTLVERDRAAAFFADPEYGSQVLIASEIGSEGRNFQFAQHLVLFDLPLDPDLLEQRIGRLDRIGQGATVHIHVPYLEQSPQALLFHWYHQGLGAFEHTCPTGHGVLARLEPLLLDALHQSDEGLADLPNLIAATRALDAELRATLERGRDRLLEYNSCRPREAEALCGRAAAEHDPDELLDYLETVFDCFGIDLEEHSAGAFIARPGELMQSTFPGLPEDGLTFTCDRATALANEDMQFVTWEHPLLRGAFDRVLSGEQGNSAISAVQLAGVRPGRLLLECIYVLELAAGPAHRYLPTSGIRVLVDDKGRDHADTHPSARIALAIGDPVDGETALRIARGYQAPLRRLIAAAETAARARSPALIEAGLRAAETALGSEIDRLRALQRLNRNVRDEEIAVLERERAAAVAAIAAAHPRPDALRLLVTT